MKAVPIHKQFEALTAEIIRRWTPGATVTLDERIVGASGRTRQVDVAVRTEIAGQQLFMAFECKHKTRPVAVGTIDEFAGKLEDIRANLGVLVSDSGFDAGARARAKQHGRIQLCRLADKEAGWLRTRLSVSVTVSFVDIVFPYKIHFFGQVVQSGERYPLMPSNPDHRKLLREALQANGRHAFFEFHEWTRANLLSIPTGQQTRELLLPATLQANIIAAVEFNKRDDAFVNDDLLAGATGLFNVVEEKLTLGEVSGFTLDGEAIRRTWAPYIGPVPRPNSLNYRRLGWLTPEEADGVVQQVLTQVATHGAA